MPPNEQPLQNDILDLLIDHSSSFAALYGSLIRNAGYPSDLDVSLVMVALEDLERRGWVRSQQMEEDGSFRRPTEEERKRDQMAYQEWLPRADWRKAGELAWDEVGLWYELTEDGRREWHRRAGVGVEAGMDKWKVDDDATRRVITVHAQTLDLAEEALRWWLAQNSSAKVTSNTKKIEPASFELRNDMYIAHGYKLTCRYEQQNLS